MSRPYAEVFLEIARSDKRAPAPREVRVIQTEYGHEIAVLSYEYTSRLHASWDRGQPVKVRWGWPRAVSEFVGYVHHVHIDDKPERDRIRRYARITCVGATDTLNSPAYAQYIDARIDAVTSELARRNGFSVLLERHNYAWPVLTQQGNSTWAFLIDNAKRVGWTVYARGTDLRCHSRAIRYSGAHTFRHYGPGAQNSKGKFSDHNSIYAFDTILAETLSTDGAKKRQRVAYGVDTAGTSYTVTAPAHRNLSGPRHKDASLVEYQITDARSVAEAQALINGEQELNRHHHAAELTVSGNARVHAGSSVRLLGMDTDADGFWYVTRAEHTVTYTEYKLKLKVGKDSLGDYLPSDYRPLPTTPGDTASRPLVHDGRRTLNQDRSIASVYTKGRWRAEPVNERILPPLVRRPAAATARVTTGVFGERR